MYNPPVHIPQLDISLCLQGVFLEVNLLEVRVHVETFRAKVVGPRDVGDHTLAVLADRCTPHPHVPVPLLRNGQESMNEALMKKMMSKKQTKTHHKN